MTTDPWQPPDWHVSVTGPLPTPPPSSSEPAWRGRHDAAALAITTVLIGLSGSLVGLLWSHAAPKLSRQSIAGIVAGSETPFRVQIGADAWFLLLSALAGVVCALVALLLRGRGPGVVLGLALGGGAAAVIAARVGFLAQRDHTRAAMHALGIAPHAQAFDILDFKVRAIGVIVAWPLAALIVHTLSLMVRSLRRSLP